MFRLCFGVSYLVIFPMLVGGCIVGESGGGAPKISLDVGDEKGIDYAWSHPSSPQALKKAGYTFVARYLSYDTTGKNLTAGEAQALIARRRSTSWRTGSGPPTTRSTATTPASATRRQADGASGRRAACPPTGRSTSASTSTRRPRSRRAINAYFDGVASVIGVARTGAYGGYYVIKRLFDARQDQVGLADVRVVRRAVGPARAAAADPERRHRRRRPTCDIDESTPTDFGQWGPNAPAASAGPARRRQGVPRSRRATLLDDRRQRRPSPRLVGRVERAAR